MLEFEGKEEMLEESFYDELDEQDQEYINIMTEVIEDLVCPHCIREVLSEIYAQGFVTGKNTTLLAVSDSLRDLVEEE